MIQNLKKHKLLWAIDGIMAFSVALAGVLKPEIYEKVVSSDWLPGTISQDIITVIASIGLLLIAFSVKDGEIKKQIIAIGLLSYLFYGYGIFVIERLYTPLYIVYMAVFAVSFWSIVYGLASIRKSVMDWVTIPATIKKVSVGFLIFIPLLFYILWTGQLLPLMQAGKKIEFAYSIYILDMAFILPALLICAVLIIKRSGLGLILAPILFFKAFTLLFSVGLGGLLKPLYKQATDPGEIAFYFGLSAIFMVLSIVNFTGLQIKQDRL